MTKLDFATLKAVSGGCAPACPPKPCQPAPAPCQPAPAPCSPPPSSCSNNSCCS